jgi:hypothetical protein
LAACGASRCVHHTCRLCGIPCLRRVGWGMICSFSIPTICVFLPLMVFLWVPGFCFARTVCYVTTNCKGCPFWSKLLLSPSLLFGNWFLACLFCVWINWLWPPSLRDAHIEAKLLLALIKFGQLFSFLMSHLIDLWNCEYQL